MTNLHYFPFQSEVTNGTLVAACVNVASPFLSFNASLNCTTAFFQGYPMFLSASSHMANLIIPYPETDNWYLSLQLVCPESPEYVNLGLGNMAWAGSSEEWDVSMS